MDENKVKKKRCHRVTGRQMEILMQFMKNNDDLSQGKLSASFTSSDRKNKWKELTELLNNSAGGAIKTSDQWRKCWNDQKGYARRHKAAKINKDLGGTGGETSTTDKITDSEELVFNITGFVSATGDENVPEAEFPESSDATNTFIVQDVFLKSEESDPAPSNTQEDSIEDSTSRFGNGKERERSKITSETAELMIKAISNQNEILERIAISSEQRAAAAVEQTAIAAERTAIAAEQTAILKKILEKLS